MSLNTSPGFEFVGSLFGVREIQHSGSQDLHNSTWSTTLPAITPV